MCTTNNEMFSPNEVQIKAWLKSQGVEFVLPEMIHFIQELLGKGKVSKIRANDIADGYDSKTNYPDVLESRNVIKKEGRSCVLVEEREELIPKIEKLCTSCGSSRIHVIMYDKANRENLGCNKKLVCRDCHSQRSY